MLNNVYGDPRVFEEWDLFVLRHQKPANVLVHFISFLLFWGSPIAAITTGIWYLWIGFFLSGLVGVFGHWVFKDGTVDKKEATSSVKVVQFSSLMALLFLTGKYFKRVEVSRNKLDNYKSGHIKSRVKLTEFSKLAPEMLVGLK